MSIHKNMTTSSMSTLILKLLEEKDLYGYELISTLSDKTDGFFVLKAGKLYPLLHNLQENGLVDVYDNRGCF